MNIKIAPIHTTHHHQKITYSFGCKYKWWKISTINYLASWEDQQSKSSKRKQFKGLQLRSFLGLGLGIRWICRFSRDTDIDIPTTLSSNPFCQFSKDLDIDIPPLNNLLPFILWLWSFIVPARLKDASCTDVGINPPALPQGQNDVDTPSLWGQSWVDIPPSSFSAGCFSSS